MNSMTIKAGIALLAAGVIAAASIGTATARVPIQPAAASVIDLSAKQDKDKKKKKNKNKSGKQQKNIQNKGAKGGAPGAPSQKKFGGSKSGGKKQKLGNQGGQQQKQFGGSKNSNQKQKFGNQGGKQQKQFSGSKNGGKKQKFGGSKNGNPQAVTGKKWKNKNVKVYKPKSGKKYNSVTAKKLYGLPPGSSRAYVHGRNYSAWRGHGYRIRYHDRWRTFVPLSALSVLLIGQRPFFPYAYIAAPEYYCFGRTEDGCLLNWEAIETIEGDLIGQCVAYCPWERY